MGTDAVREAGGEVIDQARVPSDVAAAVRQLVLDL